MNTPPNPVTMRVYRGQLPYREVPAYLPRGTNRAATLTAPDRLGESLHWATGDEPVPPVPSSDDLAKHRARVRVLILELDPAHAARVLNDLVDNTSSMPLDVAAAVLNRVDGTIRKQIGETQ